MDERQSIGIVVDMRMNSPKISIVIPTLNRGHYIVDTVKQVLRDQIRDLELVIVDQSDVGPSELQSFIKKCKDSRLRYYLVKPASGVAAKNFALKKATSSIVLFLDDDVILDPDCIKSHLDCYRRMKDIDGVAGRIKQKGMPLNKHLLRFDKYGHSGDTSFNCTIPQYTDTAPGGNMSVIRKKAIAVGGFDTTFLRSQHREESEFCDRYSKAGYKFYFEPKACLVHLAAPYGGTRIKTHFLDNQDYYKNNLYFVIKHCKLINLPYALIFQLRYCVIRRDFKLVMKRGIMFTIGIATAIKRLFLPVSITSMQIEYHRYLEKR